MVRWTYWTCCGQHGAAATTGGAYAATTGLFLQPWQVTWKTLFHAAVAGCGASRSRASAPAPVMPRQNLMVSISSVQGDDGTPLSDPGHPAGANHPSPRVASRPWAFWASGQSIVIR